MSDFYGLKKVADAAAEKWLGSAQPLTPEEQAARIAVTRHCTENFEFCLKCLRELRGMDVARGAAQALKSPEWWDRLLKGLEDTASGVPPLDDEPAKISVFRLFALQEAHRQLQERGDVSGMSGAELIRVIDRGELASRLLRQHMMDSFFGLVTALRTVMELLRAHASGADVAVKAEQELLRFCDVPVEVYLAEKLR